jgi:hypothetical protein
MSNGLEKNKIAGTNIQMTPGLEETTGFGTFQTPSVTQTPATVTRPIGLEEGAYGLPQDTVEATFAQRDPAGLWRTARIKQMGQAAALPQFQRTAMQGFTPAFGGFLRTGRTGTFADYLRGQQTGTTPAAQMGWGDVMAASQSLDPYGAQRGYTQEQRNLASALDPSSVGASEARRNALAVAGSLMGGGVGYLAGARQRSLGNLYDLYAARAAGTGAGLGGFLSHLGGLQGQAVSPAVVAQAAAATQGITTPVTAEQRFVDPTITSQNEAALNAALGVGTNVDPTGSPVDPWVDPSITGSQAETLGGFVPTTPTSVSKPVETVAPITTPAVTATPWDQEQGLQAALGGTTVTPPLITTPATTTVLPESQQERLGATNQMVNAVHRPGGFLPSDFRDIVPDTPTPTWGTPPVLEPGLEAALGGPTIGGPTIGGTNIPMTPGVAGDTTVFNQPTTPFMNMQNQVPVRPPGTFTTPTEGVMSPSDQAFFNTTGGGADVSQILGTASPTRATETIWGTPRSHQRATGPVIPPAAPTIGGTNIAMTPGIAEEGDAGFFNQLRNVPEFRKQFHTSTIKTPGIPATPTQESDAIDTMLQMSATDPINMIAPPDPALSGMRPAEKAAAQEATARARANELRGRPDDTPWGRLGITEEEWNRRRNETFNRFANLGISF